MSVGYTQLQAQRIIDAIDGDLEKIEKQISVMLARVTDTGRDVNAEVLMREARFRADVLKDTVRRRRRT